MYPPKYVEMMVNTVERPGIVAVCSLWSYIPDEKHNGSVEAFGWQFSAARTEGNRICSVCMKRSASETENRAESVPAEK